MEQGGQEQNNEFQEQSANYNYFMKSFVEKKKNQEEGNPSFSEYSNQQQQQQQQYIDNIQNISQLQSPKMMMSICSPRSVIYSEQRLAQNQRQSLKLNIKADEEDHLTPANNLSSKMQSRNQQSSSPQIYQVKNLQINNKGYLGNLIKTIKIKKWISNFKQSLSCTMKKSLRPSHLQFFNDKSMVPNKNWPFFQGNKKASVLSDSETYNYNNGGVISPQQSNKSSKKKKAKNLQQKLLKYWYEKYVKDLPVLNPTNHFLVIWNNLVLTTILLFFMQVPLIISLGVEGLNQLLTILLIFIVDILVSLNTSFYQNGQLIKDRSEIIMQYVKSRCLLDTLSITPIIIYILQQMSQIDVMHDNIYLILGIMKLEQLIQIIQQIKQKLYQKKTKQHFINLVQLLFTIILIAHLFACLWLYIAIKENYYYHEQLQSKSMFTWLSQVSGNTDFGLKEYLYGLYFIFVTMITVGYGDITPKNEVELICGIVTMLILCGVFAYSVNRVGSILNEIYQEKNKLKEIILTINNYMDKKNINEELQFQIRNYITYYFKEQNENNIEMERKIINMLSEPLRKQLMIESNKVALIDSPIFISNFNPITIQKTASLIQEVRSSPGEIIFFEGENDDQSIYFVQQGSVELFIDTMADDQTEWISLSTFSKGSCFGEGSFFSGLVRSFSVRSKEFSVLLKITRRDFISILLDQPQEYEIFCKIKDSLLLYNNFSEVSSKCFSCESKMHHVTNCPYIHYIPNRKMIIKRHLFSQDQNRKSIYRRQSKYKTLSQLKLITQEQDKVCINCTNYLQQQEWFLKIVQEELQFLDQIETQKEVFDSEESNNQGLYKEDSFSKDQILSPIDDTNIQRQENLVERSQQQSKSNYSENQNKSSESVENSSSKQFQTVKQLQEQQTQLRNQSYNNIVSEAVSNKILFSSYSTPNLDNEVKSDICNIDPNQSLHQNIAKKPMQVEQNINKNKIKRNKSISELQQTINYLQKQNSQLAHHCINQYMNSFLLNKHNQLIDRPYSSLQDFLLEHNISKKLTDQVLESYQEKQNTKQQNYQKKTYQQQTIMFEQKSRINRYSQDHLSCNSSIQFEQNSKNIYQDKQQNKNSEQEFEFLKNFEFYFPYNNSKAVIMQANYVLHKKSRIIGNMVAPNLSDLSHYEKKRNRCNPQKLNVRPTKMDNLIQKYKDQEEGNQRERAATLGQQQQEQQQSMLNLKQEGNNQLLKQQGQLIVI